MSESIIRMVKCAIGETTYYDSANPNDKKGVFETNSKKPKSKVSRMSCLYITPKRIVVAPLKTPWTWMIPFGNIGLIIGDRSNFKKAERRITMPPNDLLNLDKDNYEILNDEVQKIYAYKLGKSKIKFRPARIAFNTENSKHNFIVHANYDAKNMDSIAEDLLKIFAERLEIVER